jgi:hypothetical protein
MEDAPKVPAQEGTGIVWTWYLASGCAISEGKGYMEEFRPTLGSSAVSGSPTKS